MSNDTAVPFQRRGDVLPMVYSKTALAKQDRMGPALKALMIVYVVSDAGRTLILQKAWGYPVDSFPNQDSQLEAGSLIRKSPKC